MEISSAIPDALSTYCDVGYDLDEALHRRSRLLGQALDDLRVTYSYGVGWVDPLEFYLQRFAADAGRLSTFVGRVGDAFQRADRRTDGGRGRRRAVRASSDRVEELLQRFNPLARLSRGRPGEWDRALGIPLVCHGPASSGYRGGGFIDGPDGHRYPLVVPHLAIDGKVYTGDGAAREPLVDVLGGADPGWATVGVVEGFGHERGSGASKAERVGAAVAVGLGAQDPHLWKAAPASVYASLFVAPNGVPGLRVDESGAATQLPPPQPPEAVQASRRAASVTAVAGAMSFVPGAVAAVQYDRARQSQGNYGYQVAFQRNADGRRRALFRTYTIAQHRANGKYQITPGLRYVGHDGKVTGEVLTFYDQIPPLRESEPRWETFQQPDEVPR